MYYNDKDSVSDNIDEVTDKKNNDCSSGMSEDDNHDADSHDEKRNDGDGFGKQSRNNERHNNVDECDDNDEMDDQDKNDDDGNDDKDNASNDKKVTKDKKPKKLMTKKAEKIKRRSTRMMVTCQVMITIP